MTNLFDLYLNTYISDLGDVLCDPDAKNVSVLVMKMKEKEIPDKLQYVSLSFPQYEDFCMEKNNIF